MRSRPVHRLSRRWLPAVGAAALLATMAVTGPAAAAAPASGPASASAIDRGDAAWVLSTTDPSTNYAPTFVGNGYLAARVPAAGEGYSSVPIVTQSELAGFYAQPDGQYERRASLPTWTTLGFGRSSAEGSGTEGLYGVPGNWSCAFDELCPTRYGQISGGAFVETSHGGSIAGGYLAGLNTNNTPTVGGTDVFAIQGAPAGAATLAVRYANGSGTAQTVHLGVNGTLQQLTLAPTASWDDWAVQTFPVTLAAGTNSLEITVTQDDTARVNVDYLAAYPNGAQAPTQIAAASSGTTSDYLQSLDLRTGVLTTSFDWTSPAGDTTSFRYEVNANRADGHLGTVTATVTPHWSGNATVVDEFDGQGLDNASTSASQVDGKSATLSATVVSSGGLVTAALDSALRVGGRALPTTAMTALGTGSAGQSTGFGVSAGHTYQITKFVGAASSVDTDRSLTAATPQRSAALTALASAAVGYQTVLAANKAAWSSLWTSDISIPGDAAMTAQIHAATFYLLASMRAGVTWSTSPGGLSSDGYNGHVFWDMETWMYPALLAQYPDVAVTADTYRQKLLPEAEAAASALSTAAQPIAGAKYPWESALTGNEAIPPGNNEGNDELHVDSDIALAQWQYYEATGDKTWLRTKAWPVLEGIAEFWASRATADPAGGYDIDDVQAPDEYHDHVNNDAYTNASAQTALRIAVQAAGIIGQTPDPAWTSVADGLKVPVVGGVDAAGAVHSEYDGYTAQTTIKQADVTLLQYPLGVSMPASLAQNDLDYYSGVTDPNGPSMTDSIATIDAAALGSPGCTAYDHLQSSSTPFVAAPFDQFHETRSGGAFTFTTAEGGYLQEFLYGFTGLRWGTSDVTVDPFLPTQLPGVDVSGVKWHGSTFDVSVGQQSTTLTLKSGPPLTVRDGNGTVHHVTAHSPLRLPTRHPAATAQPSSCAGPITSAVSGKCVDITGGNNSDGTALQLYTCNNTVSQSWSRPGDGTVQAMGKCMDVRNGSNADGTPVQLYTCNQSASQQWTYDQQTGELQALGKCLETDGTANGTALVIDPCDAAPAQHWTLPASSS